MGLSLVKKICLPDCAVTYEGFQCFFIFYKCLEGRGGKHYEKRFSKEILDFYGFVTDDYW